MEIMTQRELDKIAKRRRQLAFFIFSLPFWIGAIFNPAFLLVWLGILWVYIVLGLLVS